MVAFFEYLAVPVVTRFAAVEAIAVANIEPFSRAKAPNRVLDKSRKLLGKLLVEGGRVDPTCNGPDDLGTTSRTIALRSVRVGIAAFIDKPGPA